MFFLLSFVMTGKRCVAFDASAHLKWQRGGQTRPGGALEG